MIPPENVLKIDQIANVAKNDSVPAANPTREPENSYRSGALAPELTVTSGIDLIWIK
jgi:hypothetical protein